MECCFMNLFCSNGYNREEIRLKLNEVMVLPNNISFNLNLTLIHLAI